MSSAGGAGRSSGTVLTESDKFIDRPLRDFVPVVISDQKTNTGLDKILADMLETPSKHVNMTYLAHLPIWVAKYGHLTAEQQLFQVPTSLSSALRNVVRSAVQIRRRCFPSMAEKGDEDVAELVHKRLGKNEQVNTELVLPVRVRTHGLICFCPHSSAAHVANSLYLFSLLNHRSGKVK